MIKVCDARMGLGKTQAAISYMNENAEKKFIYITPYLPEAKRIHDGCPKLGFIEPEVTRYRQKSDGNIMDDDGYNVFTDKVLHTRSKTEHTMELVAEGQNVATTHQAFLFYTPEMLEVIREKHYTLLVDESIQILATLNLKIDDLNIAINDGLIVDNGDFYSLGKPDYDGELFNGVIRLLKSRNLIKVKSRGRGKNSILAFWSMPIELIKAFDDVIVMTYMFEGSDMYYLFKTNDVSYQNIGVRHDETGYHFDDTITRTIGNGEEIARLIHIYDNDKLNAIGQGYYDLSASKYLKNKGLAKEMNSNLRSFFTYRMDCEPSQRLWSVYKAYKSTVGKETRSIRRWLPMNSRATNNYADANVLAYCVNVFVPTVVRMYYRNYEIEMDNDQYALSMMVQWIWRSAIRRGEEIWLYLPSSRMRGLLQGWLDSLATESVAPHTDVEGGAA